MPEQPANGFKTWMPIVANFATAAAMIIAAIQFGVSSKNLGVATKQSELASKQFELNMKQQQYANMAALLKEGRDLEQHYTDGTADARDVVTFYYRIFSMQKDGLLVKEQADPLLKSLREQIAGDLRVKQYWAAENRNRFSDAFARELDSLIRKGAP